MNRRINILVWVGCAIALGVLLWSSWTNADPFMVCDAQEGITKYQILWDTGASEEVDAQPDGSIRRDIADLPTGETRGEYRAGKNWTVDGVPQEAADWSPMVPFVLGRPSNVLLPSGTGIGE